MTNLGFVYFWLLALLPLALAPLIRSALRPLKVPAIEAAPRDPPSRGVDIGLKVLGVAAIAGAMIGAARPYRAGQQFERLGEGAEIVILIDRSGSMNETFAGRTPSGGEESKASASKRILEGFVGKRRHDLVGVAGFSTSPIPIMPMTDHHTAIKAAIDAMDRPGLDYTNINRGLAMALAMFKSGAPDRSRAILLLSDGAGVIDPRVQEDLRAEFVRVKVNLYWLFLRTAGSPGINDEPDAKSDTAQSAPERHLDIFFKSLGVPYRAFEAQGPLAIEDAITQVDRLERHPLIYLEKQPRDELSALFFSISLASTILLLLAKLSEVRMPTQGRSL